jgi:hypothetical protein
MLVVALGGVGVPRTVPSTKNLINLGEPFAHRSRCGCRRLREHPWLKLDRGALRKIHRVDGTENPVLIIWREPSGP